MAKDSLTYTRRNKQTQDGNERSKDKHVRVPQEKEKGKQVQMAKDKGKGKVDEQSKPVRRVQPRRTGGTLVINEGGAQKEKPPVVSDSSTETDSSEEDETPVNPEWERKVELAKACRNALQGCEILQTRWIDIELLTKLGILEDVRMLLGCMGLSKLLEMDHVCYPEHVIELISTFEFRLREGATDPCNIGSVAFYYNGRWNKLTISELCEVYGFPQQLGQKLESRESQDRAVWRMIGKGPYTAGRAKARMIGNPAIRYVHKVLTNTLFARFEGDRILEDEMALISNGLQSMFREHFLDEGIRGYEDINLGVLLAKKISSLKTWALKESRNKSKLLLGGFLTPLLKASKIRLNHPSKSPMLKLDFTVLKQMNFFTGTDGNRLRYKFVGTDFADHTVLLPNEEITRLNTLANVRFANGEYIVSMTTEPAEALLSMREAEEQETRRASFDLPLGSPRYYFSPYRGQVRGESFEHSMDTFKKSQRWHKWSARSLHNIKRSYKKKVKALEDQLSGLKSVIETYVFKKKSPPRRADGGYDFDVAMEEARRHSISHIPSSSSQSQGHKKLRHIPTPSPPSSDNQSLHLTSTDDEDASN